MLRAFTRNYEDNSTEAGFEFTFYCDNCHDGFKSSFIESETAKKGKGLRALTQGAGIVGSFLGGRASSAGWAAERGGSVLSERFNGMSPEWHKEHENAFGMGQNEAQQHFHRCHNCSTYVCDACYNEDAGLCIKCAPRQEVYVAQAHAGAMRRNIDQAAESAQVWSGTIESKTTVCPSCGKPAGSGKFCNNCGASMALSSCPKCGAEVALGVAFCGSCGTSMQQAAAPPAPPPGQCGNCGQQNQPGGRFCGGCGAPLAG
ncbi:MAG: zinc ribbon domain-containing protein [Micrococcales bacterium]|nr:zinc ribbon domain-containing protein [Micrococcales bacterium]